MQTDETPSAEPAPAEEAAAAAAMETQAEVSPLKQMQLSFCKLCLKITCMASLGRGRHSSSVESSL